MAVRAYDETDYLEDKQYAMNLLLQMPCIGMVQVVGTDKDGFYLEIETVTRVVFIVYARLVSKSSPCYLREKEAIFLLDRDKEASYSVILGTFISINGDAFCRNRDIGYMDRQGNYCLNFCQVHERRTGFYPKLRNGYPLKYGGPRNKVPMPW